MTTITHERYNNIRKEAIEKFMVELEDLYYSSHSLTLDMVIDAKYKVFSRMDKRLAQNIRRGTPMIALTVYGDEEV